VRVCAFVFVRVVNGRDGLLWRLRVRARQSKRQWRYDSDASAAASLRAQRSRRGTGPPFARPLPPGQANRSIHNNNHHHQNNNNDTTMAAADDDHHHNKASWQQLAAAPDGDSETPGPRSSHALAYVAPYVYLLAGERAPRVPVDDSGAVWRINLTDPDPEQKKWERVETNGDAPPPCIAPAVAAIGPDIYAFGGRIAVAMEQGVLGDLYRLDTSTFTWKKAWNRPADGAAASACPDPRSYHAAAALQGKFWVFGGCGPAGRLNDLWAFDPQACSWERMPDPSGGDGGKKSVAPRGGASLAADARNGRLVVVGGFDGSKELADAHAFDVQARAWCASCASCEGAEPTLPARSVLGVAAHTGCDGGHPTAATGDCSHGGHVVAFGGECDPSVTRSHDTAGKFLGDAWCGDAASGAWHPLKAGGPGPGPRGWFASCAVPGGLVLHGGLDASNERLADCWRLKFGH
jgi:hypothetical protein